jgi:hypothetical protein
LTPGKDIDFSLYFVCTIAAVVFIKNIMELLFQKETKISQEVVVHIQPELEQKNILFHASQLLENISVVKTYEIFIVILMLMNVHQCVMIVVFIIATPIQHFKKYPVIDELNFKSIIYKMIQFAMFSVGCVLILKMKFFDGDIDQIYGIQMSVAIGLFLISEWIDTFVFHNVSKVTYDFDIWIGNEIICLIVGLNFDPFLSTIQFFFAISLISNFLSILLFILFVLTKK